MQLYSFRGFADACFLLVALGLASASCLLVLATLLDHLRNYKFPALQVRQPCSALPCCHRQCIVHTGCVNAHLCTALLPCIQASAAVGKSNHESACTLRQLASRLGAGDLAALSTPSAYARHTRTLSTPRYADTMPAIVPAGTVRLLAL